MLYVAFLMLLSERTASEAAGSSPSFTFDTLAYKRYSLGDNIHVLSVKLSLEHLTSVAVDKKESVL